MTRQPHTHTKSVRPVSDVEIARRRKGFSQERVAELSGLSRTTIATIERGYVPPVETREAVAGVLNVDPSKLWPDLSE